MSLLDSENDLMKNTDINEYIKKLEARIKELEEEVKFLKYGDNDLIKDQMRGKYDGYSWVDINKKPW